MSWFLPRAYSTSGLLTQPFHLPLRSILFVSHYDIDISKCIIQSCFQKCNEEIWPLLIIHFGHQSLSIAMTQPFPEDHLRSPGLWVWCQMDPDSCVKESFCLPNVSLVTPQLLSPCLSFLLLVCYLHIAHIQINIQVWLKLSPSVWGHFAQDRSFIITIIIIIIL